MWQIEQPSCVLAIAFSTPDAIQLATAIGHKATRFYGNDRSLLRVKEIECVIVDELT